MKDGKSERCAHQHNLYLEFIRYSLNPKDEILKDGAEMDWEEMFRFASEQGILGIVYGAIVSNGTQRHRDTKDKGSFGPDSELMLECGFWTQEIERKNQEMNMAAVKLLKSLRKQGFDGCILKGQGNSLLYPKPYSRTPGDIDVWVKSDGRGKMDDVRRVIRFVKERIPEARAIYHHIDGGNIGMALGVRKYKLNRVGEMLLAILSEAGYFNA